MSDPRGEYGLIDFYARRGFAKVLFQDSTQSAHAGGAEANLASYTIPKNTLVNAGDTLRVRAWGTFAANANAKRVRALLGALVGVDSVSSTSWNGHKWELECIITLTAVAVQKAIGRVLGATAAGAAAVLGSAQSPTAGTEDATTDLALTIKGTGVAASDVVHLHALKDKLDTMLAREGRTELVQACFDFLPVRAALDLSGWAEQDIFAHT